jgi:hypothetical protein
MSIECGLIAVDPQLAERVETDYAAGKGLTALLLGEVIEKLVRAVDTRLGTARVQHPAPLQQTTN